MSDRISYDPVPPKAGHVIAAATWKWDRNRNLFRLQQVVYEPRKRAVPESKPERRRQGLLL